MYKNCNVVMLSTNEKATAPIFKSNNHLYIGYGEKLEYKNKDNSYQHLFITSDEEIKEGDYTIYCSIWLCKILKHYGDQVLVVKVHDNTQTIVLIPEHKKIIATTDTSLGLPQPSKQFMQQYIEEYNKGNIISDVEVEYDKATYDKWLENGASPVFDTLKVNPDNTINIKPIKDSWSREELRPIFLKLCHDTADYIEKGYDEKTEFNIDKWIEENL